jgi:hypothetical protein
VVLGLGALVKVVAGLPALGLLVWLWHRADDGGHRQALRFASTSAGVVGAGYLLGGGLQAFGPLVNASDMTSRTSLWRPLHVGVLGDATTLLAPALVAVLALLVLRSHRRSRDPGPLAVGLPLAYLVGSSYSLVWYLAWLLPVAALHWRSRTSVLVLLLATAYLLPVAWLPLLQLTALAVVGGVVVEARRVARATAAGQSTASSSTASAQVQ